MNVKLLKSKEDKRFVVCPVCHSPCYRVRGVYQCSKCGYSADTALTQTTQRTIHKLKGNRRDTHQNTDKEQFSLAMGSEEYQARQKDLFENSTKKEDDAFHEKLEDSNEVQAKDVRDRRQKSDEQNDVAERKYRLEEKKRTEFKDAKRQAQRFASKTETKEDDKAARRMSPKGLENIVYDDGLSEDDYLPSALSKYI